MSKPRNVQGTPDPPQSTADRKPPEDPPSDRAVPEETLASATTRDPTIINRLS